ncbi:hypothetical protein PFISCL1PPCAC_1758, partial [Pristionchus fissidentatus]
MAARPSPAVAPATRVATSEERVAELRFARMLLQQRGFMDEFTLLPAPFRAPIVKTLMTNIDPVFIEIADFKKELFDGVIDAITRRKLLSSAKWATTTTAYRKNIEETKGHILALADPLYTYAQYSEAIQDVNASVKSILANCGYADVPDLVAAEVGDTLKVMRVVKALPLIRHRNLSVPGLKHYINQSMKKKIGNLPDVNEETGGLILETECQMRKCVKAIEEQLEDVHLRVTQLALESVAVHTDLASIRENFNLIANTMKRREELAGAEETGGFDSDVDDEDNNNNQPPTTSRSTRSARSAMRMGGAMAISILSLICLFAVPLSASQPSLNGIV